MTLFRIETHKGTIAKASVVDWWIGGGFGIERERVSSEGILQPVPA